MRGEDTQQNAMFSYLSPEQRVPQDHPLRKLRPLVDEVLKKLSRRFTALYARGGRPSIPPEKLLRALLLQALYTLRSERLLMEQLDYKCAGINRSEAEDERALRERSSDPLGLEFCTAAS
jgi:transposase